LLRLCLLASTLSAAVVSSALAQDAAAGQKLFIVCRACHQIGPGAKNGVGPELNGVVGRKAGSVPDYQYSEANKSSGLTWDAPTLERYLANPQQVVPGTKMTFPGFPDPKKVKDIIAYLSRFNTEGQTAQ
jgi:cytochrome c